MNYYSLESDINYMSCSQLDAYDQCEASAVAYLKGENERTQSTAFLVGNYVHSYFESVEAHQEFIKNNYESIFTRTKSKRAEFALADKMIQTLDCDEFCSYMLQGESEVIMTGELFGQPWKIRVDKWQPEKYRIVDLKTTKSIHEKEWYNGEKVNFLERYRYPRRAAVYAEIVRQNSNKEQWPDFYIVAVSKEQIPDKAIIKMTDPERWERELSAIKNQLERIKLLRSFKIEPLRCEKCDYCKMTKVIEKIIDYREL